MPWMIVSDVPRTVTFRTWPSISYLQREAACLTILLPISASLNPLPNRSCPRRWTQAPHLSGKFPPAWWSSQEELVRRRKMWIWVWLVFVVRVTRIIQLSAICFLTCNMETSLAVPRSCGCVKWMKQWFLCALWMLRAVRWKRWWQSWAIESGPHGFQPKACCGCGQFWAPAYSFLQ